MTANAKITLYVSVWNNSTTNDQLIFTNLNMEVYVDGVRNNTYNVVMNSGLVLKETRNYLSTPTTANFVPINKPIKIITTGCIVVVW